MTSPFVSNLLLVVAGSFLLAVSLTFSGAALGWVVLGVGAVACVTVSAAFAFRGRGTVQRALDGFGLLLGVWTTVTSRCFTGVDLKWLSFSSAVAMLALASVGLVAHEILLELLLGRAPKQPVDGRVRPLEESGAFRVAG